MLETLKEVFTNSWILSIIGGIVCLLLPSPFLNKAGDKAGDAIEELAGEKARDIAYDMLHGLVEGFKRENYKGDKNIISNDQMDKGLDKYKLSVGLEGSKSKARE